MGTLAAPVWVGLSDGDSVFVLDPLTGYVVVIDILHHKIHEGVTYSACRTFNTVGAGNTVSIRITTPADIRLHFTAAVASTLKAEFTLDEGTTFSVDGTTITPKNLDRPTGDASTTLTRFNPTVNVAGLEIICGLIPAGERTNATAGQSAGGRSERVLNEAAEYLLSVTNTAAQAADIWIGTEWYEVPVS